MVADDTFCIIISAVPTDSLCQDEAVFLNEQFSTFR